jgi:hypothetical protein
MTNKVSVKTEPLLHSEEEIIDLVSDSSDDEEDDDTTSMDGVLLLSPSTALTSSCSPRGSSNCSPCPTTSSEESCSIPKTTTTMKCPPELTTTMIWNGLKFTVKDRYHEKKNTGENSIKQSETIVLLLK